jgi:hypothetical protein
LVLLLAIEVTPWAELLFPIWILLLSVDTLANSLRLGHVGGHPATRAEHDL